MRERERQTERERERKREGERERKRERKEREREKEREKKERDERRLAKPIQFTLMLFRRGIKREWETDRKVETETESMRQSDRVTEKNKLIFCNSY